MRTKVTLVLIFLNVALFFFIFKFERNWRTESRGLETRRRVLGAEAADIRSLVVTSSAPGASYSLERKRDAWSLTKPLDWPANAHAVGAIVNELQLLEHETAFAVSDLAKNNLSLADYGLDKPKIVVAFSSSDPTLTGGSSRPLTELRIGDTTKDGKRLYVLSPDRERVHIVTRSLVDSLSVPLDKLRADTLLSVRVFEAKSVSVVQTAAAESTRSSAPGVRVRIRNDGTRWTFESPHNARASKTAVELRISELNALHAKSFPATAPSPAAAPTLRITIEGNNRIETLFIGEPVADTTPVAPRPGEAAVPTPPATEYFAQLEGRNAIFTVAIPQVLLEALRSAQTSLRETRFLEFDSGAVTKIELSSPTQPNQPPVTLQRLEPPPGQAPNAALPWQVVRRGEGAQGPQTLPANRASVQRLIEQLSLLTAKAFKSDAPTSADLEEWGFNRPLREITLTLAGNAAPLVLRIGTDANRTAYYARPGTAADAGTSIYQIGSEIEPELPLSPLAWRDRAVTEPLPATARISALKVSYVDSKIVLFETTFAADGAPATPPRDPKALADVIGALRNLRAKEFVPGGFSERITAAGDDRPWRLQLEASITLPGPGGLEQTTPFTLLLSERVGGNLQFAGSKELDTAFSLEQPLIDALWSLTYGDRDPGARTAPKK
ncbi:DUF4340 domain-containing protein [Horticoccus sp. 23ND18S-11]|uniref:DUF4340 domain-containing protein n=1 Tax=Horticoccus sp. 23ND18S-11 TaxID=3391832 RepID=UPI0039C96466